MSTEPRLHVPDTLGVGAEVILNPDQGRYLALVMRRVVGDTARLFNGRDGEYRARIAEAGKRVVRLRCETLLRAQAPVPDLTLLFAPVKKARMDFIVEKATEMGVRAIRPVFTERSMPERVRPDRMAAIMREAAEQTERLDLPDLLEPEKLGRVLDGWDEACALVYCDEADDAGDTPWGGAEGRAPAALETLSERLSGAVRVAALIGPEGGFSTAERARLRAHGSVIPISLGPRILRADTAAVSALTLVQAVWGDWR